MLDNNVLIFDIETVADCDGYRLLHRLPEDLSENEIVAIMNNERLAENGSTFYRHHLHKVVAISLLLLSGNKIKLWSLGRENETEQSLIARFFAGIDKTLPTLVSWNGSGFDLPVLHYRALFHGISASAYFEIGEQDNQFRYNNYISRFHWRHIDMMDVLSGYQANTRASLNDVAKLCALPGKLDTDGSQVQTLWQNGEKEKICDYCETDVLNTYGVYLRFELLRGRLQPAEYEEKIAQLRAYLQHLSESGATHITEFLEAWHV